MARPVGATPYAARRRRPWRTWVFLALLLVPIIEIAAIIGVGKVIGGVPTLVLILVMSLAGAWLMRREGAKTWSALNVALSTGAMPPRALADAALVLIGGTLLLTPGFVTDFLGFFFILPATRPITRSILERAVRARLMGGAVPGRQARHTDSAGETVEGRIVER